MSGIDAKELERLQALCDAATPGPWVGAKGGAIRGGHLVQFARGARGSAQTQVAMATGHLNETEGDDQDANAAFIVAARIALPALLAEVTRLTAIRDTWREFHGKALVGELRPEDWNALRALGEDP